MILRHFKTACFMWPGYTVSVFAAFVGLGPKGVHDDHMPTVRAMFRPSWRGDIETAIDRNTM